MSHKPKIIYSNKFKQNDKNIINIIKFSGLDYSIYTIDSFIDEFILHESIKVKYYESILASSESFFDLLRIWKSKSLSLSKLFSRVNSVLIYNLTSGNQSISLLREITGEKEFKINKVKMPIVRYKVSKNNYPICQQFSGLEFGPANNKIDYTVDFSGYFGKAESLITIEGESLFFLIELDSVKIFFVACSEILDIKNTFVPNTEILGLDVTTYFSRIVPILMYLKYTFSDSFWRPNKYYSSLIIDDPTLKPHYGCLNYNYLLKLMDDYNFHTNIAFIPWNFRRSNPDVCELFRKRPDRYSLSIHGCDHTKHEFGTSNINDLQTRAATALKRMEIHKKIHCVSYGKVMVFPQGIYSKKALKVLKYNNYSAVVNTDVKPVDEYIAYPEIQELLYPAITKYEGIPIFVRRYPGDGIENFIFDIFLGKPCLIVIHQDSLSDNFVKILELLNYINSLKVKMNWSSLDEIATNFYLEKSDGKDKKTVKVFGNKVKIENTTNTMVEYNIIKNQVDLQFTESILLNEQEITPEIKNCTLNYKLNISPSEAATIMITYNNPFVNKKTPWGYKYKFKTAIRRYLSEFRDNHLSNNKKSAEIAARLRRIIKI